GRDDRPHGRVISFRVTYLDRTGASDEMVDHLVISRSFNQHSGSGREDLPGIEENTRGRGAGRLREIGIREDDIGRLSTQLQSHSLEVAGGALEDPTTHT